MDGGGNLPEELIYNVLIRLPAKSVGRFRCVCKHWQTLLSDPQFLKTQFNFNNLLQTKLIFRHNPSFISVDFCEDGNNKGYPIAIDETLSFKPSKSCRTILGSCNGLLLLIDSESSRLSISNPITHESRQLPPVPVRSGVHRNYAIFGFGYCSYDDDYTVVVVLDWCCISRVYMLKRNSWKRVENSPFVLDSDCGVFANGALHWLGFRKLGNSKVIYAFDLVSERFSQVELPEGLKEKDKFALDVVGGRLCLAVKRRNRRTDLWLMKEYGERMSWIKYLSYTLNLQKYSTFKPLFFWGGNEFVVGLDGRGLMLCSLKQKKSTMISVIGERFSDHIYRYAWTFSASLFSPNCSSAVE